MEIDPRYTRIMNLLEKLLEVCSPLMVNIAFRNKFSIEAFFNYSQTKIDILSESHFCETAGFVINLSGDSHIETAWMEFIQLFISSANAACCEKGSHSVIYGFLDVCERRMRFVRSAVSINEIIKE